jgi:hypothetical protein
MRRADAPAAVAGRDPSAAGPGRGARRPAIAPAIALVLAAGIGPALAQEPTSPWDNPEPGGGRMGGFVCGLGGAPLDAYDLLLLLGVGVALGLLVLVVYRLMLEGIVRGGTPPNIFFSTIANLALGTWLLAAFAVVPDVLGLCWFAIIGILFALWLIGLMATRRVLAGAVLAFIVIAGAAVAIQQLLLA